MRTLIGVVSFLLLTTPGSGQSNPDCRYDIRFGDQMNLTEPVRLSGKTRTESLVFYTERRRKPAGGSEMHLRLRHSPDLDGARSFVSVSLNYALLRSMRLDYKNETELIIPIAPDLFKERNELLFSVQHFPGSGRPSPELWTEIVDSSFIRVHCQDVKPSLDLGELPHPLLDPQGQRDQRLNVLLPERISAETLEATALLVANLSSRANRTAPRFTVVRPVTSIRAVGPLLIVGTQREQPQLSQLQSRLPVIANTGIPRPSEGVAGLITRSESDANPILVITANTPAGVLRAAKGLFDFRSDKPTAVARISSTTARSSAAREWLGFVPPKAHFSLQDLGRDDIRIRPGERGAAVVRLDTTPDARFLEYGLQARLTLDLRQTAGSEGSFVEVFLNENSLGRFPAPEVSAGSRMSLRVNAPRHLLATRNVLKIVWQEDEEHGALDGEGWLLPSTEFYLPRRYEARLPDLALLRQHFYPFALRADLSDTVIVAPIPVDQEVIAALMDLAVTLGRLLPSENVAFKVRLNTEDGRPLRRGSHFIILDVERGKATVQQFVSPLDPRKFVLKITAETSAGLRQLISRFFSDNVFNRLEGDTVQLASAQPMMRRAARQQLVVEHFYLTRLEAWLRSNWLALPVILAVVSVLMFVLLRLALNQYRTRSNGAV